MAKPSEDFEERVLRPYWPPGLEEGRFYRFLCDDKGADGGTWFQVLVANDGDCHLSAQDWEDIREEGSKPRPFASIRCRTGVGGGQHRRTRQALLWLARAIQLDNEELGRGDQF